MKSKNYGGKRKSNPRRRPPPRASTFSARAYGQDEADGRADGVNSITTETSCQKEGLSPGSDTSGEEEEYMDLGGLNGGVCIICDVKDCQVLFCGEIDCPISVHEKCLSCKPWFDDLGNFYCPYCSYKRALVKTCKLRKKVTSAKKALSTFLGNGAVIINQEQHIDEGNKRKKPGVLVQPVDGDCENRVNCSNDGKVPSRFQDEPKGNDNSFVGCTEKDRMIVENEGQASISEMHPSKTTEYEKAEQAVNLGPKDEGILEDKEETDYLNVSPTEVDTAVNCAVNVSNGAEDDFMRVCEKNDSREEDEEQMQTNELNESAKATKSGEEDIVEAEPLSAWHFEEETTTNVEVNRSSGVNAGTRLYKKNNGRRDAEEDMLGEHFDGHSNVSGPEDEDMEKAGYLHTEHLQEETSAGSNGGANANSREEDQQHIEPEHLDRHANANANVNLKSEVDIFDTETLSVRRRRFKTKAQKRAHIQHVDSSRQLPSQLKKKPLFRQPDNVEGIAENLSQKAPISKWSSKSEKQSSNLYVADAKRKRFFWTAEEEATLKKGVELLSSNANRNMPWRKVLDYGRGVFHPIRTPADLKDKWRKIMAKKALNS